MIRCSIIAGVAAATVVLSACGARETPAPRATLVPTAAPVETHPTATPEAAGAIENTYQGFGNPGAGVVVVLSQGGPMLALVRKREILEKLGLLNLERIHLAGC